MTNTNQRTLNVCYDRFENFKKFHSAKTNQQTTFENSLKKFVQFDDIK